MMIKDITETKDLPEFYLLFIDDEVRALEYIGTHQEAFAENKMRVVMPVEMYRFNKTLAIRLEDIV